MKRADNRVEYEPDRGRERNEGKKKLECYVGTNEKKPQNRDEKWRKRKKRRKKKMR